LDTTSLCFVTACAFVTFWGATRRRFRNADDIHVLTITIRNRESGFGMENGTAVTPAEVLRHE
jgi:hypothetical protein